MYFQSYTPSAPLSESVASIWYCEGYDPPNVRERLLPHGAMTLIINLSDAPIRIYDQTDHSIFRQYPDCLICGVQTEYVVNDTRCQARVIGIEFKGGGALPFFNIPIHEFRDQHVPLDCIWGFKTHDLRDQLQEVPSIAAKFRVVETYLLRQRHNSAVRHPVVPFALNTFHYVPQHQTIAEVTDQIGLSQARFIHVFREAVGVTPKVYCRIRRFQQSLNLIRRSQDLDWAELALACGYYDQAHFIHDFNGFAGISPAAYQALHTRDRNHVPL